MPPPMTAAPFEYSRPADIGEACALRASDEARFITGTEIVVDGGMTVRCD